MPLFLDVHHLGDPVALNDVAQAHAADLQHQTGHDVHYLRYWVGEPTADPAVHREAHGLPADEIYQVQAGA